MKRLPKISLPFGPIITMIPTISVQHKLIHQLYIPGIMLTSCQTSIPSCDGKFWLVHTQRVWNRNLKPFKTWGFYWLVEHPGVRVFLLLLRRTKTHQCTSWPDSQVQMPAVRCCARKQVLVRIKYCRNKFFFLDVFFFCVVCFGLTSLLEFKQRVFFLLLLLAFLHRCFGRCFTIKTLLSPSYSYCLGKLHIVHYCSADVLLF